jgi:hypothetical protein
MSESRVQHRRYSVYVVELSPQACRSPSAAGCVYVGETGLDPVERLARHKAGARTSSAVVHRFGLELRPDLSEGIGPFATRDEATAAEAQLASALRRRGFTVFGGQGRTFGADMQATEK